MATVTSQLTRIHDLEGTLVTVSIGGGPGAAANTDIFIQGAQSLGRRTSNVTDGGYLIDDATSNNLSADNVHIAAWVWVTHYSVVTAMKIRIASNSAVTNYDQHLVPLSSIPATGGWMRVWIDISRTPEEVGGTGLDEAAVRYVGPVLTIPTVGGNVANMILDAIDYTTGGLLLTGTAGAWSDFTTADNLAANKYGVLIVNSAIYYCYARLTLGSASSLIFNQSNFVLVFADQPLVSTTFMGITIDLQNASTNIDWASGVIRSANNTIKGDIIVTGTAGDFDAVSMTLSNLRAITLTSAVTLTSCNISSTGLITQAGATITECTVAGQTGTAALLSNAPNLITSTTFTSPGTGHAIQITTPGTYTFSGNVFVGYAGSNGSTGNEAIYNNSGGAVTLNITNGGSTPSVRNGAGASTTVNANVQITLTGLVNPSEVRVYNSGTTTEIAGQENVTTGTFVFSTGAGVSVDISILALAYQIQRIKAYSTTNDATLPIQQIIDRQYLNP